MGGWLVGLPFTSAPIAFFLARDEGLAFAAAAAVGIMAGTVSQAVFCLAYARTAVRAGWPAAFAAAAAAFVVSTLALRALPLALLPLAVAAAATLVIVRRLMPAGVAAPRAAATVLPWWDIPARMVATTGYVLLLTGVAPHLGPRLTGLITPFPLYAAVLVIFAHALEGPARAAGVLRGLILGLYCFVGFFLVLAAVLERWGIALGFTAATIVALAIQGAALWTLRRGA
ncbi:MAG TPA: hypothetical protein VGT02_04625 [Methylomirabilota bacterium]|nr:hypothetical protein [Methylomirabilota bacterium]